MEIRPCPYRVHSVKSNLVATTLHATGGSVQLPLSQLIISPHETVGIDSAVVVNSPTSFLLNNFTVQEYF